MVPSVEGMTRRTQAIYSLLDEAKITEARQEARTLYREGLSYFKDILNQDVAGEMTTSVMVTLNGVVAIEKFQHADILHRTLSKVYRFFVELALFQCINKSPRKIYKETRDKIIANCEQIQAVVPKEKEISTSFEYACAKQAAKYFTTSEGEWLDYLKSGVSIVSGAKDLSIAELWEGFTTLLQSCKKDIGAAWYPSVGYLRGVAVLVKNVEDFNRLIQPRVDEFQHKGGKYSICLAIIFMEMIKDDQTTTQLKKRLVRGSDSTPGLVDMVKWESHNESVFKHPQELFNKLARKADRFWQTRQLVMHYLYKISSKNKYQHFQRYCIAAINERIDFLNQRKNKHAEKERTQYQLVKLEYQKRFDLFSQLPIEEEMEDIGRHPHPFKVSFEKEQLRFGSKIHNAPIAEDLRPTAPSNVTLQAEMDMYELTQLHSLMSQINKNSKF